MTGPRTPRRVDWWTVLRWTLLAVCLVLIVRFLADHRDDLAAVVRIHPGWVVGMLATQLAYFALHAHRYLLALERASGRRVPAGTWFRIFVLGRFLNTLVPQSGNVYRAVRLKRDHGISVGSYVGSMISFAWMDTALSLLLALGVTLATGDATIAGLPASGVLAALLGAAVAAPFVLEIAWRWVEPLAGRLRPLHGKIAEMLAETAGAFRDLRYLATFVGLGTVVFALASLLFYLCFTGLGVEVRAQVVVVFVALFKLGNQIALTPGNLGVVELASGGLAEALELGVALGIVVSAAIRVVYYTVLFGLALPMGGLDLLGRRRATGDEEDGGVGSDEGAGGGGGSR